MIHDDWNRRFSDAACVCSGSSPSKRRTFEIYFVVILEEHLDEFESGDVRERFSYDVGFVVQDGPLHVLKQAYWPSLVHTE